MEEATDNSGALAVEEVMALVASLDPAPKVIHIDLRSPSRNSYIGGKATSMHVWRELRFRVPSFRFLHLVPLPATMDLLLNAMRTKPGRPRTPTSRSTPPLTWSIPPPP